MSDETFKMVPLRNLRLDPGNPRLPRKTDEEPDTEDNLLREFYRRYNLIELARSIADKGFQPRHAEALLVVNDPPNSHDYVVIEGNRRLATLKLLTCESKHSTVGIRDPEWKNLAQEALQQDLENIPVIVYPDRQAIDDYLGFRHITGPKPWRPEAKARFIAKLLEDGETVGAIARRIGSNHRTVRRYAEAHQIYVQALEAGWPMDEVEAAFGVFYNALDQSGVRNYLDLGRQVDIDSLPEAPVNPEKMENLRELLGLLYGDSEQNIKAVIRESRELRKMADVLNDQVARAHLLSDRDLDRAWRICGGGRQQLLGQLADLRLKLAEVNGQATEFRDDDEIQTWVKRIHTLTEEMMVRYGVEEN